VCTLPWGRNAFAVVWCDAMRWEKKEGGIAWLAGNRKRGTGRELLRETEKEMKGGAIKCEKRDVPHKHNAYLSRTI
jgi:hypothetical protein